MNLQRFSTNISNENIKIKIKQLSKNELRKLTGIGCYKFLKYYRQTGSFGIDTIGQSELIKWKNHFLRIHKIDLLFYELSENKVNEKNEWKKILGILTNPKIENLDEFRGSPKTQILITM